MDSCDQCDGHHGPVLPLLGHREMRSGSDASSSADTTASVSSSSPVPSPSADDVDRDAYVDFSPAAALFESPTVDVEEPVTAAFVRPTRTFQDPAPTLLHPSNRGDDHDASSPPHKQQKLDKATLDRLREERSRSEAGIWSDPCACQALCDLLLDDLTRHDGSSDSNNKNHSNNNNNSNNNSSNCNSLDLAAASLRSRRPVLPPGLIKQHIAPYCRFDTPVPNMLYAFGGRNQSRGPLDLVEMFDTWHGKWVECPPMPTRRAGASAALLPDGRIMVIGGYTEKGIAEGLLSSSDIYDPVAKTWSELGTVAPMLRGRWGHGCAVLNGKVYVVGGCSLQAGALAREVFMETLKTTEVYDPVTNKWVYSGPLKIARSGSRVVPLGGDRYLAAIGGCDDVFGRAETQATVEIFDGETEEWSVLKGRLSHARTTAAAVAFDDQRVLVVGGAPSLSSAEVFEVPPPEKMEFEAPDSVDDTNSTDDNNNNNNNSSSESNSNNSSNSNSNNGNSDSSNSERQDQSLATNRGCSTTLKDLPEGRMGCQAALLSLPSLGRNYPLTDRKCAVIIGGERCHDNGGSLPVIKQFRNVQVFDIEANCWRDDEIMPEMSVSRTATALCVGVAPIRSSTRSKPQLC